MTIDQLAEYIRSAASECNSGTFDLPFDIARYIAYHLAAIYNDTDRPITQGQAKDLARINVPKALLGEPQRAKVGPFLCAKLKGLLAELWGDCCPDCGPEDYENIVKMVGEEFHKRAAKWISVKERLPEKWEFVLARDPNMSPPYVVASREYDSGQFTTNGGAFIAATHWQPLPDPPAPAASSAAEGIVATGEGGT
jgi:hypothetical protein